MQHTDTRGNVLRLILGVTIMLTSALAQSAPEAPGSLNAVHKRRTGCESGTVISNIRMFELDSPEILIRSESTCPLGGRLTFLSSDQRILSFYTNVDRFLYMYPAGLYSHLLVSLWEGGSHVAVRVFRVGNQSIDKVFDGEFRVAPEIMTSSDDEVFIIASKAGSGDIDIAKAPSDLYSWNGKRFVLLQTAPFNQRFSELERAVNDKPAPAGTQ